MAKSAAAKLAKTSVVQAKIKAAAKIVVLPIAFSISLPALLAMGSQGCGGARAPLKSLPALNDGGARSIELPKGLEDKRAVYLAHLAIAEEQLLEFARTNKFEKEPRPIERVRVFTSKSDFDKAINVPATNGTDARFKGSVPSTVVGAIVGDALFVVSEPLYFQTFPGHVERDYEKLLTHELAHRYHQDLVDGDADAMGPIWFFEGFATLAADQYVRAAVSPDEAREINRAPDDKRGYEKYRGMMRLFQEKTPMKEMVRRAKSPSSFSSWIDTHLAR